MSGETVVTVDITGSKEFSAERRRQIQRKIFAAMEDLRENFAAELFTVGMTGGDEFQIVLNSPKEIMNIFGFLSRVLPTEFYFGVGVGSIEAVADNLSPPEMYGSAFYSSRKALRNAKDKKVQIVFNTAKENLDFQLNTIIELILFIRGKWTNRQREILNFLESHKEIMQKEVAEHFSVSEQAISKIIKRSGYEAVKRGERLITTLLATSTHHLKG